MLTLTNHINQKSDNPNFSSPNLVFIDSQIDNPQFLISGIYAGIDVVVIPQNQDGIKVITATLEKYIKQEQKLDAIHIFSHGSPGSLKLGNIFLNQDTIKLYQNPIQKWQAALNITADILLYGCNVAAGIGEKFIVKLHQLTKANIAASVNLIGAVPGDWKLEFTTGKITAPQVLKTEIMASYNGTFNDDSLDGSSGDDSIKGAAGNDTINGGNGNDTLGGGIGNDVLNGNIGNDSLTGWWGNDIIDGGDGFDTLQGGDDADTLNGGGDADTLKGGRGNDLLKGDAGDDFIQGQANDDELNGGNGNDTVGGGNGNDIVNGNAGNDSLTGWWGDDTLTGGTGNDIVKGGDGLDILNGEQGTDTLTGGSNSDRFIFDLGSKFNLTNIGSDIIKDFNSAESDKIVLDKTTFTHLSSVVGDGFSVAGEFAVVDNDGVAATSSAKIVYNSSNGKLFYNSNGATSGFGDGGLFATLENQANLQATDFVLTSNPTPEPTPTPTPAEIASSVIKFTPSNTEAEIAAKGGPSIEIGTQTIYIGTWQKSSNNQNPIIASFEDTNPANNWVRTDYESTGADSRGRGLFWDGDDLYAVFSFFSRRGNSKFSILNSQFSILEAVMVKVVVQR